MLSDMWIRLRCLFRRQIVEAELDDEMRFHFERQVEKYIAQGMEREEARRRARLEFGGSESVKEECREARGVHFIETLVQDVLHGVRMLKKAPGFTVVAVVTLALGIGANAAIFSVVNAFLFRPLPARAPQEIVSLVSYDQTGSSSNGFSYPDFEDIRSQTTHAFNDLAGVQMFQMDGLSIKGQSQPIWTSYVTANFFQVMGVQPAFGSIFQPIDGKLASSDPVMVLGYSFWQSRLGGDRNLIGQSVSVNGHPVTIIGVAPKGFCGISPILDTQAYLPIGMAAITADSKPDFLADRKAENLVIFGRLSKSLRPEGAKPELDVVARRISEQFPDIHKWESLQAFTIGALGPSADSSAPGTIKKMAALFLVLVGLVLVLACMNVANLLLARAAARQREMAIRSALGATRTRLVRQLLTESLLLALLGCGAGILLGLTITNAISSVNLSTAIPIVFDLSFDWRVFAYALCAALMTGMLVGAGPAIRASRGNPNNLLHENLRTSTIRRQR
ncbi:MAG TPA: ABC transporter permease, partial [Candidatus Angelobacter sp.]|nr:ABC transporter permease [Candidatus Angelobacter sp.]